MKEKELFNFEHPPTKKVLVRHCSEDLHVVSVMCPATNLINSRKNNCCFLLSQEDFIQNFNILNVILIFLAKVKWKIFKEQLRTLIKARKLKIPLRLIG